MNLKIGFIGSGNMAQAIIGGMIDSNLVSKDNIYATAVSDKTINLVKEKYGVNTSKDNKDVVNKTDIIFLAVKPNVYKTVIDEIKDVVDENKLIVTIAAGQTIENIEDMFGKELRIIRTMPNTPALVGEGMGLITANKKATNEDVENVVKIFNSFGKSEIVEEALIDTAGSLSGCGPAYTYMYIEALADAAVESGVKRDLAYKLAAQMVLGSAKMVLESGEHPGALKDNVCSPGGTTIKGVNVLEKAGFRGVVIDALLASINKTLEMSNNK
ncbi:pyrroline-5-carboxylate reductase [Anaerofustis sp. NSJ-163]|uniref:pyrroline-5-carboxylate reductase n=1 Tax=Anaerofustis sp. NSJ-163 TaxID=2944391 RepID=UPI00209C3F83|nr:pyrroline-5-carboxylate reductase [Anaerofustis sp. NSJ-163]MCO8193337.1 pyrroline-5-carboxylate reductase [Anaerofustis sp. NSJ-163]